MKKMSHYPFFGSLLLVLSIKEIQIGKLSYVALKSLIKRETLPNLGLLQTIASVLQEKSLKSNPLECLLT